MEFLGNLGIDVKLLVAQILNFGLLLWLLTKFLYKPVIQRIEKDEEELKQAQIQKSELEQEKSEFLEKKKSEELQLKEKTRKVISEAELIAKKIKISTRTKVDKEAEVILRQTRDMLGSLRPDIEKEIFNKIRGRIGFSFQETFSGAFPLSLQKEFQDIFWIDFFTQFKKLMTEKTEELKSVSVFKKTKLFSSENGESKRVFKQEAEKIFVEKNGPVILEYAHSLTNEQKKSLEEVIFEKIGVKLKIVKKQNKDLINGFRLEVAGTIIESNLLSIVNEAASLKHK